MSEFGTALKEERKRAKKKLRELSEYLKLSIGYLSDVEQGRKGPPELEIVKEIENYLETKDQKLLILAEKGRTTMPKEMAQKIYQRPKLSELFFRVKDMPDEELDSLIDKASEE